MYLGTFEDSEHGIEFGQEADAANCSASFGHTQSLTENV